jgi:g-D-glutamyl-meso-diaminopimelate peptidase
VNNRLLVLVLLFLFVTTLVLTYADDTHIVDAKALYSSSDFVVDIYSLMDKLNKSYPSITNVEIVGKSVEGRDLKIIKVGKGKKEIFINAAHHGKEYMTTILTMQQIQLLLYSYENNAIIDKINIKNLLDEVSIVFMPLVNPDGVMIAKHGRSGTSTNKYINDIVSRSKKNFSDWKANARGVDLNRNYDTTRKYMTDIVSKAGARNYPGLKAFSEPETQAVKSLCDTHDFELVIAYHTAGEIIYWYFFQEGEQESRDHKIASIVSEATGYKIIPKTANPGGGGMKDWFVQEYKKTGLTIEIGKEIGEYKILRYTEYPLIWRKNSNVPIYLANAVSTTLNPKKTDLYDIKDKTYRELVKDLVEKGCFSPEVDKYGNKIFNGSRIISSDECIKALNAVYTNKLLESPERKVVVDEVFDKLASHFSDSQVKPITYAQCIIIISNIENFINLAPNTGTNSTTSEELAMLILTKAPDHSTNNYIQVNQLKDYEALTKHAMAYLLEHIK